MALAVPALALAAVGCFSFEDEPGSRDHALSVSGDEGAPVANVCVLRHLGDPSDGCTEGRFNDGGDCVDGGSGGRFNDGDDCDEDGSGGRYDDGESCEDDDGSSTLLFGRAVYLRGQAFDGALDRGHGEIVPGVDDEPEVRVGEECACIVDPAGGPPACSGG